MFVPRPHQKTVALPHLGACAVADRDTCAEQNVKRFIGARMAVRRRRAADVENLDDLHESHSVSLRIGGEHEVVRIRRMNLVGAMATRGTVNDRAGHHRAARLFKIAFDVAENPKHWRTL